MALISTAVKDAVNPMPSAVNESKLNIKYELINPDQKDRHIPQVNGLSDDRLIPLVSIQKNLAHRCGIPLTSAKT